MERLAGIVTAVIPAWNEEDTIASVVRELEATRVDRVIVVDAASSDDTVAVARRAGAEVIIEPRKGYGRACLAGIDAAGDSDVLVFLDGDGSDDATAADVLIDPILANHADLVLGARSPRRAEPGAIAPAALAGNALASFLIRLLYRGKVSDLSPFKAVRGEVARSIAFQQVTYGWTTELIVTAAQRGLRIAETAVNYRRRGGGKSKVSGTVKGSVLAGISILHAVASSGTRDRVIVVAKPPLPGVAKTRLARTYGNEAAARFARASLADTISLIRTIPNVSSAILAPNCDTSVLSNLAPDMPIITQRNKGLLAGLEEGLARSAAAGFARTVIIDADSPTLPPHYVQDALRRLDDADVVFGPTRDGGYYLVGSRRPLPRGVLQVEVPRSSVLSATVRSAQSQGLRVALTKSWYDIDTVTDLPRLAIDLANGAVATETSAVLQTLQR